MGAFLSIENTIRAFWESGQETEEVELNGQEPKGIQAQLVWGAL
jgi:hypothetical protein